MGNILTDTYKSYLAGQMGDYAPALADALENSDPSVAVRANRLKISESEPLFPAITDGVVPWCDEGTYLSVRPDFTRDPRFHQGGYYVQDASSMAIGKVVAYLVAALQLPPGESIRYLDACAAPGGKTTAAIAALPPEALVVANEFDYRRAEILKENVIKWGSPAVAVSRGDTARFRRLPEFFHIVAADVPCSGEGMMRKDATAAAQWTTALVDQCVGRQKEILENLWHTLMPGGYLIYSTCTFNRHENEDIISWIHDELGGEPLTLQLEFPGAIATETMYRFLPGRVRGEGLAIGVVRKPGSPSLRSDKQRKKPDRNSADRNSGGGSATARLLAATDSWLSEETDWIRSMRGDQAVAYSARHADAIRRLDGALDLIHTGITLGTVKGKGLVPDQSLAMSVALRRGAFPEAEADTAGALSYLRREAAGGFDAPKGYLLLTFGGSPLGFVNHLGNRSNNLYPQAWRILH